MHNEALWSDSAGNVVRAWDCYDRELDGVNVNSNRRLFCNMNASEIL
jgi:hypothetical protein